MQYSIEELPHSIRSEHIRLHILKIEDADSFYKVTNTPEITRLVSFLSYPVDPDFSAEWILKNESKTERVYGIFTGVKMVGHIGAHLDPGGEVEIGYWVNPKYMGKGIATTAVRGFVQAIRNTYPEYRIFSECRPDNVGSIRVLNKNGFSSTGNEGKRPKRIRFECVINA